MVITFMTSMPKSIINSPTGARIYLSVYNGKDHFAANYDGDTDSKDGSTMNWGNTIVSARWNYIFNNRLFSNTTVSYNNYLFDVNSYNNNKYANSMGASIINRYSADYSSGINDWSYQIVSIITRLPHTTLNLVQDISIIGSVRRS